jgi:hypothetical protein
LFCVWTFSMSPLTLVASFPSLLVNDESEVNFY